MVDGRGKRRVLCLRVRMLLLLVLWLLLIPVCWGLRRRIIARRWRGSTIRDLVKLGILIQSRIWILLLILLLVSLLRSLSRQTGIDSIS